MKWLLLYFFLQVVVPKQHAIPEVPAGVLPQADTTLGVLILVNKEYKLPKGYRPHDLVPIDEAYNKGVMNLLRSEAAAALPVCVPRQQRQYHLMESFRLPIRYRTTSTV